MRFTFILVAVAVWVSVGIAAPGHAFAQASDGTGFGPNGGYVGYTGYVGYGGFGGYGSPFGPSGYAPSTSGVPIGAPALLSPNGYAALANGNWAGQARNVIPATNSVYAVAPGYSGPGLGQPPSRTFTASGVYCRQGYQTMWVPRGASPVSLGCH